ncbi:UDP-2,3-diacylglucosamine diphosphatase [Porticoccus sp. W117]|uniref:UDP-2,3-diacylglucosamine diphosphatase n=1 Tax=Porticoccus sp. W117 TaxID=3054777 RepID=UPI0025965BFF|nr:UDP-2,3-diacylglucosamine diphosphatase [Porticoccus sp. W117]MDM3871111.1 UDP-2,3-diacylglucosamine diphosphatase [Porticoccus sp. W117]
MTTLFISDLHLAPERPEITQAFYDFLNGEAREAKELYILGDLFEAWVGDDDPSEFLADIKRQLRSLSDSGTHIYFLHGNRDFMVGKRFAKATGCTLLPEHHVIDLYGERVLLLHGDTLCTDDLAYQKFRRKVRNPLGTWLLGRLPLKKRLQIAADWRNKSMNANSNKSSNIMDVNGDEVERFFNQFGVKTMIHGHTHRPARHHHDGGERIVLGDWHHHGWVLTADENCLELSSFAISPEN